jgi:SSS family solute:Na+ symporter
MEGRMLDVVVIALYLIGMLVIGFVARSKAKGSASFFVANRNLGYIMFVPCLSALVLGGSSTLTTTRLGYEFGIGAILFVATMVIGIIGVNFIMGPSIIKYKLLSVGEVVGIRFGKTSKIVLTIIQIAFCFCLSVVQVVAVGTLLSSILGIDPVIAMLIGGFVGIIYSSIGGMLAVTFTDFVQWIVLTFSVVLIFLPLALGATGGFGALDAGLPAEYFDFSNIGWGRIFSFFMLYALGFLVDQSQWQRTATARDIKTARRGSLIAGAFCLIYVAALTIIGMCGQVMLPGMEDPQGIYGQMILNYLPIGLAGLVIAGCLSAIMSTMSGPLLAAGTVLMEDIVKQKVELSDDKVLKYSKWVVFILGVLAIFVALFFTDILVVLDFTYSLLTGAMLAPALAALLWDRCTTPACLSSMIISALAMFAAFFKWGVGPWQPILIAFLVGMAVIVIVSLITKPEENRLKKYIENVE